LWPFATYCSAAQSRLPYEAAFRENEIGEKVLPNLTAEDLKDLGVGMVGHRRVLLDAIAALRAQASAPTPQFENPGLDEASRRKELDDIRELLKSNLQKVVQHGKRADSIVKNMLLHSRERTGERRSTDLNALVGESLNLAYHGARAGNASFSITLKHDLDPDAGALELYPQEITRALLNIISNGFYAATRRKAENGAGAFEPVLRRLPETSARRSKSGFATTALAFRLRGLCCR
jgi:signal transduction histidine kinase